MRKRLYWSNMILNMRRTKIGDVDVDDHTNMDDDGDEVDVVLWEKFANIWVCNRISGSLPA